MSEVSRPLSWAEFAAIEPAPGGERIRWGEGPREVAVLRLPEGAGPHPVVALLHGGCWSSEADAAYMSHLAAWLAGAGWATWTPSFPRSDDPGGGWPGTLGAVGRALDHLRRVAARSPLDLSRMVAAGHSSGGHLALWLAARARLPETGEAGRLRGPAPIELRGVIGLAPIADLLSFHREGAHGCGAESVERLMGGAPVEAPAHWSLADPARLLPLGVPQLLLTGALDDTVPPDHPATYGRRARDAGDDVKCTRIEGAGHFEVVAPGWDGWPRIAEPISRFLAAVAPRAVPPPEEGRSPASEVEAGPGGDAGGGGREDGMG